MDDLIRIRGGKGTPPALRDKELGYDRDNKALLIGTESSGNVVLCRAQDISAIEQNTKKTENLEARISELESKLEQLISPPSAEE